MDFLSIFDKYGLPILVIFVIGWFLFKELWPWARAKIDEANAEAKHEREEYLASLNALREMAQTQHAEANQRLTDLTKQIADLAAAINRLAQQPK